MWISDGWKDYRLVDCGGGKRLEYWGKQLLVRPDPQAIWQQAGGPWQRADAVYHRSSAGGGSWEVRHLPQAWTIGYKDLVFNIKPMSFKHTGVFPEQACNWDFAREQLARRGGQARVLNMFAYTGGATIACAAAGASVCHVDASRGMVAWAKENAKSSGLEDRPIRWIVDDCVKFLRREIRRGSKYDAIIMDPPSYGRGPNGEVWRFEDNISELIDLAVQVLSDKPLFFIINSYTAGISPSVPAYLLGTSLIPRFGGHAESQELGLPVESTGLFLPCGHTTRWASSED